LKGSDDVNEPSPDLFLDAALGYQKTAAIKAAIALDLFTALAEEDGDAGRVAVEQTHLCAGCASSATISRCMAF